jgi:hypothetical protein
MAWQTADWFFVVIFLVFVAMLFIRRSTHGPRGNDGGADGQPPNAGTKDYERHGPTLNM